MSQAVSFFFLVKARLKNVELILFPSKISQLTDFDVRLISLFAWNNLKLC